MKCEIWTFKTTGKNKDTYQLWKTITTELLPRHGTMFTYITKTNKQTDFRIDRVDYAAKNGRMRIQLCVSRWKPNES